jgi:hypothetical protein
VREAARYAGAGSGQGTLAFCINPKGTITEDYIDASNMAHGFLVVGE